MKRIVFAMTVMTILAMAIPMWSAEDKENAGGEKKITVKPSELPREIRQSLKREFPNGKILSIEKEVEGEDPGQYDIELIAEGKKFEIEMSPEGKFGEVKEVSAEEADTEGEGEEEKDKGDAKSVPAGKDKQWTSSFHEEDCSFQSKGHNRFFILEPGYQLTLESKTEKVVITVLKKTFKVGSIETRVVEEREEQDGKLKEISRNYFAICKEHGDVFYFGEEVDEYEDGKVVAHSGQWKAGQKDSKAGILMPGTVLLGARHYQEIAPNAKDRAEIIRDDVTFKTPAGTFKNCILVEETSGLDPEEKGYKTYAPGIGLVQDEDLLLTRITKAAK